MRGDRHLKRGKKISEFFTLTTLTQNRDDGLLPRALSTTDYRINVGVSDMLIHYPCYNQASNRLS
jgi:hypothetical protein